MSEDGRAARNRARARVAGDHGRDRASATERLGLRERACAWTGRAPPEGYISEPPLSYPRVGGTGRRQYPFSTRTVPKMDRSLDLFASPHIQSETTYLKRSAAGVNGGVGRRSAVAVQWLAAMPPLPRTLRVAEPPLHFCPLSSLLFLSGHARPPHRPLTSRWPPPRSGALASLCFYASRVDSATGNRGTWCSCPLCCLSALSLPAGPVTWGMPSMARMTTRRQTCRCSHPTSRPFDGVRKQSPSSLRRTSAPRLCSSPKTSARAALPPTIRRVRPSALVGEGLTERAGRGARGGLAPLTGRVARTALVEGGGADNAVAAAPETQMLGLLTPKLLWS